MGEHMTVEVKLVRQAVRNARPKRGETAPRWACVRDAFGIGSRSAQLLCNRFDLDPDEELTSPPCECCPLEEESA